jgi:hypothetical protein
LEKYASKDYRPFNYFRRVGPDSAMKRLRSENTAQSSSKDYRPFNQFNLSKNGGDFRCLWATQGIPRPAFSNQVPAIIKNVVGTCRSGSFHKLSDDLM